MAISFKALPQSNYFKYSVGGGAGVTRVYGDLDKSKNALAIYGVADFYLTPFVTLGLEGQVGQLRGGDSSSVYKRYFKNSYMSGALNVKAHLGAFFDKGFRTTKTQKIINGIYVGTGIGIVRNKITESYHVDPRPPYDQGRSLTKDAYLPVNVGIDYAFRDYRGWDRLLLNVNFQGNLSFGEGLDGYDDAPVYTHNQYADIYIFTSVGIKYKFGLVGYHK